MHAKAGTFASPPSPSARVHHTAPAVARPCQVPGTSKIGPSTSARAFVPPCSQSALGSYARSPGSRSTPVIGSVSSLAAAEADSDSDESDNSYSFAGGSSAETTETRNEDVDKDDGDSKNQRNGEGEVECPVGCGECGQVGLASSYTAAIRHGQRGLEPEATRRRRQRPAKGDRVQCRLLIWLESPSTYIAYFHCSA